MTPEDAKKISRCYSSDMSPDAVEKRIKLVSQLRDMAIKLGKFEILNKVDSSASPMSNVENN